MANEYATLAELKTRLRITDTNDDVELQGKLITASRDVEKDCGRRRFWADPVPVARTFNPLDRIVRETGDYWLTVGGERLLTPDIASLEGLVVEMGVAGGSTWVPITDYEPVPDNALADDEPITGLRWAYRRWSRTTSTSRVRITARWGWPVVPEQIKEATLLRAARLFRRKDSPDGIAGNNDFGLVHVSRWDPDYDKLIGGFTLPGIG